MSTIKITNLTFGYNNNDLLFDNVSLNIDTEWRLALVGRNGKGKTTLLKILAGHIDGAGGIEGNKFCRYFPYAIDDSLTVTEIIDSAHDIERWRIYKELNQLDLSDIDGDKPLCCFSGGEQTKILLALLFADDSSYIMIDEPTNHLDRAGRMALAKYLSNKQGYIIVSHDREFVDGFADHTLSIDKAKLTLVNGNMTTYLNNKANQDNYERNANTRLGIEIERLSVAKVNVVGWADDVEATKIGGGAYDRGFIGAQSAKMQRRAKAIARRIDRDIQSRQLLLNNIDRDVAINIENADFFKQRLLQFDDVVVYYNCVPANKPFSLTVSQGQRIALVGRNGSGKSSIIKATLGLVDKYDGVISKNNQLTMSYVSQSVNDIVGTLEQYCNANNTDKTQLYTLLYKLGLDRAQFDKDLSQYSMGQKKKLLIAASLASPSHIYLWDEALNYVDVISRRQIETMLLSSNATMLFVEHDGCFCDNVATEQISID